MSNARPASLKGIDMEYTPHPRQGSIKEVSFRDYGMNLLKCTEILEALLIEKMAMTFY